MIPQLGAGEYSPTPVKLRDRVLVVDGEPLVRWALTASLTAAGYDVVTAPDAAEACAVAAHDPQPAVVLLDVRPQDTDGQAVFDQIRRVAPLCRLLVLTTERRRSTPAGWCGVDVIEKPFDLAEVVRLVGAAISVNGADTTTGD